MTYRFPSQVIVHASASHQRVIIAQHADYCAPVHILEVLAIARWAYNLAQGQPRWRRSKVEID